jgi:hypothetical protein
MHDADLEGLGPGEVSEYVPQGTAHVIGPAGREFCRPSLQWEA